MQWFRQTSSHLSSREYKDSLIENDHCPHLRIESSFTMINRDITQRLFLCPIASDNDQGSSGQITLEFSSLTSPSIIYLYSNGTLFM